MKLKGSIAAALVALTVVGCSSESTPEVPPGKVDVSEFTKIDGQLAFLDTGEPVIDEALLRNCQFVLAAEITLLGQG